MNEIERAINLLKSDKGYIENMLNIVCPEIDMAISALEKQLNDGWIPVSEILPNKAGEYICTVKFEDNSIGSYPVWFHNGIRTDILWEMDDYEVNVIAWQPLPPVWKGNI